MRSGAAWFAGALLIAGCGGSSGGSTPRPEPAPATQLASLAGRGATASYSADYDFIDPSKSAPAKVSVWHRRDSLRVDITIGTTKASIISAPGGTWSCATRAGSRSCLTIAKPGEPVPKPFDIAPANLFTTDLAQLSDQTGQYDVTAAEPFQASGPAAGARCFDVLAKSETASAAASPTPSPSPSASGSPVPAGRYCFTADGLLAAARYPSGNTVQLTSAQVGSPPAAQFTPYAKPTPLPS